MNKIANKTLVLITETYPFGAVAESFLDKEIPYLSKAFNSIVIIPSNFPAEIERVERKMPENVKIDTSLLQMINSKKRKKYFLIFKIILLPNIFHKEIFRKPKILFNPYGLKIAISYLLIANIMKKWFLNFTTHNNVNFSHTLFYTYWLGPATFGLGLIKEKYPKLKLVSRAHGGDLYEERYSPPYIPFRVETFKSLNYLFIISNHGKEYLINKYPNFEKIFTISRLGVENPGFINKISQNDNFRIISCSYIISIKRIHLIIASLKELGQKRPEIRIEWTHIGYGPLLEEMKNLAINSLPKNIRSHFLGFLPNCEVINYYKSNPIDVFINVSASEGIPVSIMEAQSCGIPVIATAVGGTPEIVSDKVGILLSENPSPEEIAKAIEFFVDHPEITKQMRMNSIENWKNNFNAEKNFSEFANKM